MVCGECVDGEGLVGEASQCGRQRWRTIGPQGTSPAKAAMDGATRTVSSCRSICLDAWATSTFAFTGLHCGLPPRLLCEGRQRSRWQMPSGSPVTAIAGGAKTDEPLCVLLCCSLPKMTPRPRSSATYCRDITGFQWMGSERSPLEPFVLSNGYSKIESCKIRGSPWSIRIFCTSAEAKKRPWVVYLAERGR